MDERSYLSYIVHFLKNIDRSSTVNEIKQLFTKSLGTLNLISAPEEKVKQLARKMYKAYVLSQYLKIPPFIFLDGYTTKELNEMMLDLLDFLGKYQLPEPIDTDFTLSNIDRHIERAALEKYKRFLAQYMPEEPKVKKNRAPRGSAQRTRKESAKRQQGPLPMPKGKICQDILRSELNKIAESHGIEYSGRPKEDVCRELGIKM